MNLTVRRAMPPDADAMARIYNDDIERWFDSRHPMVVAERDGRVVGFGATFEYRPRECYAGIAEASVYVAREARLVSGVFPENTASLALLDRTGFRHVGRYEKHAQLDGVWRDVIIVEKLL